MKKMKNSAQTSDMGALARAIIVGRFEGLNVALRVMPQDFLTAEFYAPFLLQDEKTCEFMQEPMRTEAIIDLLKEGWVPKCAGFNPMTDPSPYIADVIVSECLMRMLFKDCLLPIWVGMMKVLGPHIFAEICAKSEKEASLFKDVFGLQCAIDMLKPSCKIKRNWLDNDVSL